MWYNLRFEGDKFMRSKRGIVLIVALGTILLLLILGGAILRRTTHQAGSIFQEMRRIKAFHLLEGTATEIFYRQNQGDAAYLPAAGSPISGNSYLEGDSWHSAGSYDNDTSYTVEAEPADYPAGGPLPGNYKNTITLRQPLEEVKIHAY
jgi:hypothetical protein